MKQFAYCPIILKHEEVVEYVKPYLKEGYTIVVHRKFDNTLHHFEYLTTIKNRANDYGDDLYLFKVDDVSNKDIYIDCGSFN